MEGGQAAPHRLWQSCSMFLFSELFVSEHLLTSNKEALDLEFPMALPLCPLPQNVCLCPNPRTLNGDLFGNRVFANMTLKTRSH